MVFNSSVRPRWDLALTVRFGFIAALPTSDFRFMRRRRQSSGCFRSGAAATSYQSHIRSTSARQGDVMVISATTPNFRGDLPAVAMEACFTGDIGAGIQFWDVTEPEFPRRLAFFRTIFSVWPAGDAGQKPGRSKLSGWRVFLALPAGRNTCSRFRRVALEVEMRPEIRM